VAIYYIILALLIVVLGIAGRRWWKKQRRDQLLTEKLSSEQIEIIRDQVPLLQKLPANLLDQLSGKINLFLDQADFIGCNGLEVTDEMRLSIAAQACLIVVNSDAWYENLSTILIYPGAFKSKQQKQFGHIVSDVEQVRIGESWSRGPVILSWHHVQDGAFGYEDGTNVVLHEFAHQLDDRSGHTNGIPILSEGQTFNDWERDFVDAYKRHVNSVERGLETVIDPYGAEGYEEFFAVAVEAFFELPSALENSEPSIYNQLSLLLNLDPVRWS
jgi:Mlc titration factor MtfA (ptsG expression regulator)